jgi:glycosyltransferase involved in cell wall biosynthesis
LNTHVPRLAIVSTHPIQYYAPLFRALTAANRVRPRVFFTWSQTAGGSVADADFGKTIAWDIPLLEGYEFEFVPNVSRQPGTHHFRGLQNPSLTRAIEDWGADALLVFGWNSQSHLQALRHFKGRIPVLFRGDSTLLDDRPGWRRLARKAFLSWVYRHIDAAIAVGSHNADYYRWCGVPEPNVAFAPHAVDVARFSDRDGDCETRALQWRQQLGIAPSAPTVVFAGKFIPKKDPLLLLEAFKRSGAQGHLVFAGNGALEGELQSAARSRADVHFLPFQNQQSMPVVYRLGSVFALPSRGPGETWGLAVNEAMACGRPAIVGSKVGGARDLIATGINGWTFESGNLGQLTDAIRQALSCTPERLHSMGAAAQRESQRWSIEAATHGIENAVTAAVDAGSRPIGLNETVARTR